MYKFHDITADAYKEIHAWLEEINPEYRNDEGSVYDEPSEKNTAAQFDNFFHAHAFKVQCLLEEQFKNGELDKLLVSDYPIFYIDIACSAGASSVAFLNTLLQSNYLDKLAMPMKIHFIGVDIDKFALRMYTEFMELIKKRVDESVIQLKVRCVPLGIPEGITEVIDYLKNNWDRKTNIPHVVLTQVNAVRPFKENDDTEQQQREDLRKKQIPIGDDTQQQFSRRVIDSYRRIIVEANIDLMTMIFIGTKETKWSSAIDNLAKFSHDQFNANGLDLKESCLSLSDNPTSINYENPVGSRHRKKYRNWQTKYFAYIGHATNSSLIDDKQWNSLISIDNLRLAWVRSRHYMLRESLVDEFEIRLFESAEEYYLEKLQQKLTTYLKDLANTSSRIAYDFPKKWNVDKDNVVPRPRVLTRFEEDILAVAVVQVLGKKSPLLENSYEYQLQISGDAKQSEYLYLYYLIGYQDFIENARSEAKRLLNRQNSDNATIIQTDIESFYTNVRQNRLIDEIHAEPSRLKWLLEELIEKPIPETKQIPEKNRHKDGFGLVQGGTASGFFAKLFLRSLHEPIIDRRVKLFRYADDIIMTIPPSINKDDALEILQDRLSNLGLSLSEDKTFPYSPEEFLSELSSQDDLDDWDSRIKNEILRPLYAMNLEYRQLFDKHNEEGTWFLAVNWYQERLKKLGIYLTETYLSRRIQQNLRPSNVTALRLPDLDYYFDAPIENWIVEFKELNQKWVESTLPNIKYEIEEQLIEAWSGYNRHRNNNSVKEQWHLTRIRFFTGRLVYLGFGHCTDIILSALREPNVLRNPRWIIEAIVKQGMNLEFLNLLDELYKRKYVADDYMRAICARALRYLPEDFNSTYDEYLSNFLDTLIYTGTNIEKLMATETLIFVDRRYSNFDYCKLLSLLNEDELLLYPQLIRNISLIIQIYCDQSQHILENFNHPVIHETFRINRKQLGLMIKREESDVIRGYYNSEYPDIDDQGGYSI